MAQGPTSVASDPAASAAAQQQVERTAPLETLKQEIGTEFVKLHATLS